MPKKPRVQFDPQTRYIYVDGIKICQYDPQNGVLIFYDKNKERSRKRGTQLIGITLSSFCCGVDSSRCTTFPTPFP